MGPQLGLSAPTGPGSTIRRRGDPVQGSRRTGPQRLRRKKAAASGRVVASGGAGAGSSSVAQGGRRIVARGAPAGPSVAELLGIALDSGGRAWQTTAPMRFPSSLLVSLLLVGCSGPIEQAAKARAEGDHLLAAELYGEAAVNSTCPERGQYLLLRADMQELAGRGASAVETIGKAVEHCPDLAEGWWMRAQRRKEAGDRAGAMEDAQHVKEVIPEAQTLYNELAMAVEVERSVRQHAASVVDGLRTAFVADGLDKKLPADRVAVLARQVPVPLTIRYSVKEEVSRPTPYSLVWVESWSFRGEESDGNYEIIRSVELPPLEHDLPLPIRLLMSNQRMPMRFTVDPRGQILSADWAKDGPDRGMRPEMLRPEVQGTLRRRRLFDPGEGGQRAVGDTWQGEDVRVLDGLARNLTYSTRAVGWVEVRGLRTLQVSTTATGPQYRATEERFLHPESSVVVRLLRTEDYSTTDERGTETSARKTMMELRAVGSLD